MSDNAYLDTIKRMEPDIGFIDAGAGFASIAISLKRIADAMAAPRDRFLLRAANGIAICTCETMERAEFLNQNLRMQIGNISIEKVL